MKSARIILLLLCLIGMALPLNAQEAPVQEIFGQLENGIAFYDLFGLKAGDVLYVYAESSEFDTLIGIGDIDFEEVFLQDDDGGGGLNSAFTYNVPADGDYSIAIRDCCDDEAAGGFRMLLSLGNSAVLNGSAQPNGAEIAVFYELGGTIGGNDDNTDTTDPTPIPQPPANVGEGRIQELTGRVSPETEFIFYDLFGLRAGDVIYVYAESNEFDTMVVIGDIDFEEELGRDDDGAEGTNSALTYVIPEDGDYSIAITDCCRSDVTGNFRALLGLNAPDALTGTALPRGEPIAVLFEGLDIPVEGGDRSDTADCDELQERPTLSGPELTRETQNFIIHYTQQGRDGATNSYIDAIQNSIEDILKIQTQELGWPLPPADCGEGGDGRFDIYIQETLDEGALGFAEPGGLVGDNPNSSYEEIWAAYSFLVIDNDMSNTGEPPLPLMRATAAHEFHHSIQFGYDINEPMGWIYEATATWMETKTFTEDEDATGYVVELFESPSQCIGNAPGDFSNRIYAEWIFIDSLARDFGDNSIIRLWELVGDIDGMKFLWDYLAEQGSTPQEAMTRFAIRNLLLDYELAGSFDARVSVDGFANGVGTVTPTANGVQQLGVDYVLMQAKGTFTLSIDQPNLTMVVVGVDQAGRQAQAFDIGQSGTIDTSAFDFTYVIIINTNTHDDIADCEFTNWQLTVADGTGAPLTPATGEIWDASRFAPAG